MKRATRAAGLKKKTIIKLKRLTSFLENRWSKKTSKNLSPIVSLAPKVIIERDELKGFLANNYTLRIKDVSKINNNI